MSEALHMVLTNPDQARQAIGAQLGPYCRALWDQGITRVSVVAEPQEDQRSLQQNAFYWAFVLKTIKLQAVIDGIGADENGWHLYFKRRLLGYRVVKTKVPGKRRPSITRELRSTTKLKVPRMSKYLDEVMAIAATEFGVTFDAGKRWEDWQA